MESINLNEQKLMEQIRNAASLAFDFQRAANTLFAVNQMIAQRAQLAYMINRGLIKDECAAIEQFKSFTEHIKQHLNL